jgi:hypothetical protein
MQVQSPDHVRLDPTMLRTAALSRSHELRNVRDRLRGPSDATRFAAREGRSGSGARQTGARRNGCQVLTQERPQPENFFDPPHLRPRSLYRHALQKGATILLMTSVSVADPPALGGGGNVGYGWRNQSAKGGDYDRLGVAITIGQRWRLRSAFAGSPSSLLSGRLRMSAIVGRVDVRMGRYF